MPLQFDMPLDKLREYQGLNPRPDDFDVFWDNSLSELDAVEPDAELTPANFETSFADCFHLSFTGIDGARLHAKYLRPKMFSGPKPAVLMFHGYSSSSGDWSEKLGYVAQGLAVAVLDCRGQGGLSEDRGGVSGTTLGGHIIRGLDDAPKQMLFRLIFLDTVQLARVVMDMAEVDETRMAAIGGSQGGGLALACAALEPRIKLAAVLYPFLVDYKRVWEIDLAADAYGEIREYFRHFDPTHQRKTRYSRIGVYRCPTSESTSSGGGALGHLSLWTRYVRPRPNSRLTTR